MHVTAVNFVFEKGMVKIMKKDIKKYEPPSMKVYRFTDQDKVLTESGEPGLPPGPGISDDPGNAGDPGSQPSDYAASALNQLFGGTNTTIE